LQVKARLDYKVRPFSTNTQTNKTLTATTTKEKRKNCEKYGGCDGR
jgi:hypothetical protein